MAYTEDDLNLLATVPQLIGSAIASASGSGLFGTGKELFANANAILDGLKSYPGNALIKQLLPDPSEDRAAAVEKMKKTRDWAMARLKSKGIDNAEKLRAQTLEDTRAAAAYSRPRQVPQRPRSTDNGPCRLPRRSPMRQPRAVSWVLAACRSRQPRSR